MGERIKGSKYQGYYEEESESMSGRRKKNKWVKQASEGDKAGGRPEERKKASELVCVVGRDMEGGKYDRQTEAEQQAEGRGLTTRMRFPRPLSRIVRQ